MTAKEKRLFKKYSRYTDNRVRKNKSVLEHRLNGSLRERATLNFLLKRKHPGESLLRFVYEGALSVDRKRTDPDDRTELEKKWAEIFKENEEIVERVVHSIFQWFGTNVGYAEITKLAEILKEWPNKPSLTRKQMVREREKVFA